MTGRIALLTGIALVLTIAGLFIAANFKPLAKEAFDVDGQTIDFRVTEHDGYWYVESKERRGWSHGRTSTTLIPGVRSHGRSRLFITKSPATNQIQLVAGPVTMEFNAADYTWRKLD